MDHKTFPTLTAGVMLTSGASWTKGVIIPIVGANVIESISGKIVIDTIVVEALVPTGFTYELFLFSDASGLVELARLRFVTTGDLILSLKKIDVHDALYGALACQAAGAKATISIQYRIV